MGYDLHGGQGAPGLCIPNTLGKLVAQTHLPAWVMAVMFAVIAALVAGTGVAVYRWRIRQEMRGEIRAIMREYMPLDSADASELGSGLLGVRKKAGIGRGLATVPVSASASGSGSGHYIAPHMGGQRNGDEDAFELAPTRRGGPL